VLGVDWKSILSDAGQNYQDFAPPGRKANPVYFISRAKLSVKMASISMDKKLIYTSEVMAFRGIHKRIKEILWAGSFGPKACNGRNTPLNPP